MSSVTVWSPLLHPSSGNCRITPAKSWRQPRRPGLYAGQVSVPRSLPAAPFRALGLCRLGFAPTRNNTRPLEGTHRGKFSARSRLGWSGKIAWHSNPEACFDFRFLHSRERTSAGACAGGCRCVQVRPGGKETEHDARAVHPAAVEAGQRPRDPPAPRQAPPSRAGPAGGGSSAPLPGCSRAGRGRGGGVGEEVEGCCRAPCPAYSDSLLLGRLGLPRRGGSGRGGGQPRRPGSRGIHPPAVRRRVRASPVGSWLCSVVQRCRESPRICMLQLLRASSKGLSSYFLGSSQFSPSVTTLVRVWGCQGGDWYSDLTLISCHIHPVSLIDPWAVFLHGNSNSKEHTITLLCEVQCGCPHVPAAALLGQQHS